MYDCALQEPPVIMSDKGEWRKLGCTWISSSSGGGGGCGGSDSSATDGKDRNGLKLEKKGQILKFWN